ncbi:MAG TPA: hypothetical protein VEB86_00055, partial [Chryseosolibacter sp.]|nr:hypothetical protein [Chryseosolibacter sp.]
MKRNILMLEHDEDDRYITQAVFDEFRYPIALSFVANSDEFFRHLSERDRKKERLPSLILLNYHSAPESSTDIIRDLKSSKFAHIPVVVLSGSVRAE